MGWIGCLWRIDAGMRFALQLATAFGFALLSLWLVRFVNKTPKCPSVHDGASQPAIEPLEGFDWRSAEPRKFRPFKPVYHISMALQSTSPSDLITVDKNYLDRVNLRRDLIRQHGPKVLGCTAQGNEAVRELYSFLLGYFLPTRFPTMFELSGFGGEFRNLVTGKTHPAAAAADSATALRVLGETVEEDMFLLHETPAGHVSVAVVCCFPAGFDPSAKLGKLLRDIHRPVPSYDKIGPSMERFFARLEVGKVVKRLNWVVQTHDRLFNSDGHGTTGSADSIDTDQAFLRVERQTLSRLPRTRAVLFSFKTYLYPLRQIKDEGLGPELAAAVEGLKAGNAPGMWAYKGGDGWSGRVCAYLRA